LAIREELTRFDPNNAHYRRQLAFSHHNVGLSLVEAGDITSALGHFHQELRLFESLSAADPKDVQARRNCSLAYKQIGDALGRNNDVGGALVQYRAALNIDRNLATADPSMLKRLWICRSVKAKSGQLWENSGKLEKHWSICGVEWRAGISSRQGSTSRPAR
jgi:tetratricopeptide (TPR) repeat protein